jgi:membrane-associated phospholipid phosphatase
MGRYLYILIAGSCFALMVPALLIDIPVARSLRDGSMPGDVEKGVNQAEVFAHGVGIFFIGLSIVVLDPKSRRKVVRMFLATILVGLVINAIKVQVVRDRPQVTNLDTVVAASETFHGYHLGNWEDEHQAFVSGHTGTAFALAIALTEIYPHGRWLFFFFATLAGLQRLTGLAHYPSDVLGGAGLGLLVGVSLYCPGPISQMFDKFENEQIE